MLDQPWLLAANAGDMPRIIVGANADHVGNIEPCRLLRCHVDVLSAFQLSDMLAPCQQIKFVLYLAYNNQKNGDKAEAAGDGGGALGCAFHVWFLF